MRRYLPRLAIASLAIAWTAWPSDANAQFRYPGPYAYPYPYGAYYRYGPESDLRVEVTPKDAAVYVDGYFAGTVDEFDGVFQRLHVAPGEHEIVVYLEGYRSIRERLYLSPNATRKIVRTMDQLAPGETSEPVPQPIQQPERAPGPPVGRPGPRRGMPPGPPPPPPESARGAPGRARDGQGATLTIRVQPEGTDVLIDGERWEGPSGDDRLLLQVTSGHHRVEIRKDGYDAFTTDIDVRGGQSLPLNVSLPRSR